VSLVITEPELKQAIAEDRLIHDGQASSVEGLKYDFALGSQMLFGGRAPIDAAKLPEQERAQLVVRPGELVYVMSAERLELPSDIRAELSLKRKISHLGIMVLGGSSVDPGYTGRLVFALFNLSTRPFPLQIGRKLIAAHFFRLDPHEIPPSTTKPPEPMYEFPDDLVQLMQIYEPSTNDGLRQYVGELTQKVDDLKRLVETKEEWFDRFQKSLAEVTRSVSELTQNVDKLREGLRDEIDARKQTAKEVIDLRTRSAVNNALLLVGVALVAALVGGVAGFFLSKLH